MMSLLLYHCAIDASLVDLKLGTSIHFHPSLKHVGQVRAYLSGAPGANVIKIVTPVIYEFS